MYPNPRTCSKIETWVPKWKKLKADIMGRKAKLKQNFL